MVPIRNNGHNSKLKVLIQPNIGLDSDARHAVVEILNHALANEAVLALKTRNAHWNVSGPGFFELQTLFEIQYKEINSVSDEISKRARMLGGRPIGSFEEFEKNSRLHQPSEDIPDILELLADHEAIIRFLREDAKKCTEEYEDEGTRDFLVDVLRWHEKMAWMLRAYVEPELTGDEN